MNIRSHLCNLSRKKVVKVVVVTNTLWIWIQNVPCSTKNKKKLQQEVSDSASTGLLGLINWPMIAPFLITRADGKNRVTNWMKRNFSLSMEDVWSDDKDLNWQDRKQPFRIPRWENIFFGLVSGEPPSDSHTWTVCFKTFLLLLCSFRLTLGSSYEENSS